MARLRRQDVWEPIGDLTRTSRERLPGAPPAGAPPAADGDPGTCLRIEAPAPGAAGVFQYALGAPDEGFAALAPGHRYTLSARLRAEGLARATVRLKVGGGLPFSCEVPVGPAWSAVERTFDAPPPAAKGASVAKLSLEFDGPGAVWVDDLLLRDAAQPAFAIRPEAIDALRAFRPGSLRIWSGQTNTAWGTTLDDWLAPEAHARRLWTTDGGAHGGLLAKLPTALSICEQVGARPWLIVHPSFSEEEWLGLLEFLAGPPESPWGAVRAARGRARPWTEAFDAIRVELGNETWNSTFAPWTFQGGADQAAYARLFLDTLRSSPYFGRAASKIEWIAGGFVLQADKYGVGAQAAKALPEARLVDVTAYLGGWEARAHGVSATAATDPRALENLLQAETALSRDLVERQAETLAQLGATGAAPRLALYEAGPGYSLPTPRSPFDPAAERVGKSLAAGTATLDAFLYASQRGGGGPACFFAFAPGFNWTSHTAYERGFRPHAAWLALALRNQHARGDLVEVAVRGAPEAVIPARKAGGNALAEERVPLLGAYAFRDGAAGSVILLSRSPDRELEARLRLPREPARRARLTRLAGAPGATNIDADDVRLIEEPLDLRRETVIRVPPAAALAIEYEDAGPR
jgi:hypothetical protein